MNLKVLKRIKSYLELKFINNYEPLGELIEVLAKRKLSVDLGILTVGFLPFILSFAKLIGST